MTELIPLASLPASRLPALANLHCATMPTLLTELGYPFVLRYYQIAQTDPSVIAFVATHHSEDALAGYCLGSPHPLALTARLRSSLPWFAGQLMRLSLTRPFTLFQLAQSVFSASPVNALRPGQIELTYIGVAPHARQRGLGKTLLTTFLEASQNAGYTSVILSVETENLPALALYQHFGFAITQTFTEGRYHRHRMERLLA